MPSITIFDHHALSRFERLNLYCFVCLLTKSTRFEILNILNINKHALTRIKKSITIFDHHALSWLDRLNLYCIVCLLTKSTRFEILNILNTNKHALTRIKQNKETAIYKTPDVRKRVKEKT